MRISHTMTDTQKASLLGVNVNMSKITKAVDMNLKPNVYLGL